VARKIFKYPLKITDQQTILMPAGARILSAQYQGAELVLWALVNPDGAPIRRYIWIIGTGNPMPSKLLNHIDTVQMPSHPIVWHVFEEA
jgi:hypothetical protein